MLVVIVRVRVVSRKTVVVVGDWRFDYLSGRHLQSQVSSSGLVRWRYMMSLVLVKWLVRYVVPMIGRVDLVVFRYWSVDVLLSCWLVFPTNRITTKRTNHDQDQRHNIPSSDETISHDSEDDYRSGSRNVSHQQQQQSSWRLLSPGRSQPTYSKPVYLL